jgi:hypothetical protein
MTAQEYLKLLGYDHAGNVLIGAKDAPSIVEAYDSLSAEDKAQVHLFLGED